MSAGAIRKGRYRDDAGDPIIQEALSPGCEWDWYLAGNWVYLRIYDEGELTSVIKARIEYEVEV